MIGSKIDLILDQLPRDTSNEDITDLYNAVHQLHSKLSSYIGAVTYSEDRLDQVPISTTINSQGIDRIYCKALVQMTVGNLVAFTSSGNQLACTLASASSDRSPGFRACGAVVAVLDNDWVEVALSGIIPGFSGLIPGQTYDVGDSGTLSAAATFQKAGFAVSPTEFYLQLS